MIRLPLTYSGVIFGHAKVDDDKEDLTALGPLSITIPRTVRRTIPNRPDIILAMLKEDESLRARVTPFISFLGTQILLAHMVLRGEIVDVVLGKSDVDKEGLIIALNIIRRRIGLISYENADRTDCRVCNLREIVGV